MQLEHHTLPHHILEAVKNSQGQGIFSQMLLDIGVVGKIISKELNRAGLAQIIGVAEDGNASGDQVQKLDVLTNQLFKDYLKESGHFAAMASEEEDGIVVMDPESDYVIAFDPLDGSSNIDYNVSVGTIFSIHKRVTPVGEPATMEDFLQPGHAQVAAGYIIYGSSTMLVYSVGNGVHGFTLDQSIGEWLLSHPDIQIPDACEPGSGAVCDVYSVNEAYVPTWDEYSREFLAQFKQENPKATSRHIGSLVADIHRNMLKGGLHMRPYDDFETKKAKLRINFELKPMAFIVEQAGGYSTDGTQNILDIVPESLHQKHPFICGNESLIKNYEAGYTKSHTL